MRNRFIGAFALALLAGFLYLLMRIATLPLESGEAYPAYSSLRADPLGTKALYESLAALPELRVERNFQPLPKLKGIKAAVLLLGESVSGASDWSEEQLKFFESMVNEGGRVVIAFLPEPPQRPSRIRVPRPDRTPPVVKRWQVSVESYEANSADEAEKAGSMPRETFAYFEPEEKSGWRVLDQNDQHDPTLIERDFGKGQILLLTESYPLSNEGLRAERDVELIELLAGANRHIVFDESHLGVSNTGSVGTLIRQYRLTGAFAVLLLLGLLFLWKNASSLMPQLPEQQTVAAAGADARSGLINLLKRSVPPSQLAQVCWDRWKDTRVLGRPVSDQRVAHAAGELAAASSERPVATYKKIQHILTEKT